MDYKHFTDRAHFFFFFLLASGEALGGDLVYSGALSLYAKLPGKKFQEWPVRAHAFVNTGSLVAFKEGKLGHQLSMGMRELLNTPRVAIGLGLAVRASIA